MNSNNKEKYLIWLNSLEILGILLILFLAFALQFLFKELPCPLCLLQRIGFIGIALGLLFNLRFGIRPAHYSLTLLSALFTAFVALRQIALHVLPGDPGYGSRFLGLHFYTWSFVAAMLVLIYTSLVQAFSIEHHGRHLAKKKWQWVGHGLFLAAIILIAANMVSTFYVCGWGECPDNPTHYIVQNMESSVGLI